jgi:hypothetical protein
MKTRILNRLKWICLFLLIVHTAYGKIPVGLFPEVKGWQLAVEPKIYTPDNLWDLIDGAADVFLSYDFQDLHIGEYTSQGQTIRVEIYRQSSPVNAFGIYAAERMPDYNFINLGAQGYSSGGAVNFYTGDFYVKIMTSGSENVSLEKLEFIGEQINSHLGQESKLPAELAIFPEDGKIKNAENYVAKNFLGYGFLKSAFTAEYQGEKNYKLFIMHFSDNAEAKETLKKYFEQVKFSDKDISDKNYMIEDPYNGNIFIGLAGNYLLGTINLSDETMALSSINKMRSRIPEK